MPKLRFPEFKNDDSWNERELSELGHFTGGGTPSKEIEGFWQGDIPWISSSDINEESITEININRYISEAALKNSATKLVPKNSILLISRVGVGKLAITNESICTSQDFTSFTPIKDNLIFLAYYLKFQKKSLLSYSQGMAIKGFTKDDIIKLKLFIPYLKEQQKIADCLSSLDDLITAENDRLDALKKHKKGLMQQLFPAEGEKVPKFRFPEFKNSGDWEEMKLGEVCTSIASGKDKLELEGALDLYGSTGIIGKTNSNSFTGDFILVARVGANAGMLNKVHGTFGVTDNTLVLSLQKDQKLNFVYYLLDNFGLNKLIFGSGQPLVTGGQLKNLLFTFPNFLEQGKIADCLSALDEQINKQVQKIENLKLHKKGLMQDLFPRKF